MDTMYRRITARRRRDVFPFQYERHTIGDLRTFIQGRTGQAPPDGEAKPKLLAQLYQLDADATFPFMELPSEMRNIVYRELLTKLDRDGRLAAHPSILATSKEIQAEATSILYEEGIIHIDIRSTVFPRTTLLRGGTAMRDVHSTMTTTIGAKGSFRSAGTLASMLNHWPNALTSISNVALSISLTSSRHSAPGDRAFVEVNHALFLLSCLLQAKGSLKHLSVRLPDRRSVISAAKWDDLLFPLTKLSSAVTFDFHFSDPGVPRACEATFRAQLEPTRTVFDLLQMERTGRRKATALMDLLCDSESQQAQACWRTLQRHLASIHEMMSTKVMMGADGIDKLTKEVRSLHDYMESRRVRRIEVEALVEALKEE